LIDKEREKNNGVLMNSSKIKKMFTKKFGDIKPKRLPSPK